MDRHLADARATPGNAPSNVFGPAVTAVVTGLSGYIVLVVSARTLSPTDNAHFLVYWGLQYMVFGTLVGITLETTRSVHQATRSATRLATRPIAWFAAAITLSCAVSLGATSPWWAPRILGPGAAIEVVGLCVGAVLFGLQCSVTGALVGTGQVPSYSRVLEVEAVCRLALVGLVAIFAPTVPMFALAASLAAGGWLALGVIRRPVRQALSASASERGTHQTVRLLAAMGSAAGSALLVVGFPVLVALTSTDRELAGAAPVLLAVSLTRAPLLLPLSIYQNLIVTRVAERGVAALRMPVAATVGLSFFGAALAYVIGPWALELVQDGYVVSPGVLAGLVLAAGCTALITLSGAAALTVGLPGANLLGWLAAAAAGTALLTLDLPLDTRIVIALFCGPSIGAALHVIAMITVRRSRRARMLDRAEPV
ncbi:MAG: hypothetical protein ACJ71Z_10950 [Aeromicrobium sp.]